MNLENLDSEFWTPHTKDASDSVRNNDVDPDHTVLEFPGSISGSTPTTPMRASFGGELMEAIVLAAPLASVRQQLVDVSVWPVLLAHVHHVKVNYDDGMYQEVSIDLDDGDGGTASVRSVRRCEPRRIRFFQPDPPRPFGHLCGEWLIHPLGQNTTHLTLVLRWTLSARTASTRRSGDTNMSDQSAERLLRGRARAALLARKRSLEWEQAQVA